MSAVGAVILPSATIDAGGTPVCLKTESVGSAARFGILNAGITALAGPSSHIAEYPFRYNITWMNLPNDNGDCSLRVLARSSCFVESSSITPVSSGVGKHRVTRGLLACQKSRYF
jgi:hypothetical protein